MGNHMSRRVWLTAVLLLLPAMSCSGDDENSSGKETTTSTPAASTTTAAAADAINPADFTNKVDHPFFSLVAYRPQVFEGTERDPETKKTIKTSGQKRLLDKTEVVAGVTVAIIEHKEFDDGELIEVTQDYFAQHKDGTVWYFGERVDDYEGGKVAGHEGSWLAGEGKNKPGIYLPVNPTAGQEFEQERAPGLAEDRSTILAVGAEVTTKAGKFTGCLRVKDYAPLSKTEEFKFYCPKVGIVREEEPGGTSDLVRFG
jgi:hypothetical protein